MPDSRTHAPDAAARIPPALVARTTLIVFGIAALFVLLWQARYVLLLGFGAVVVAVMIRALARRLRRMTGLPDTASVLLALLLILSVLGGAAFLFGQQTLAQAQSLGQQLPAAWEVLRGQLMLLGVPGLPKHGGAPLPDLGTMAQRLGEMGLSFGSGLVDLVIVAVGGVYLAAQPRLYRTGLLKLVPEGRRDLAATAIGDSGRALGLWLKGQLISMLIVGLLTGIGLWLLGVPSALALALLAAVLEFVPLVGPILAAIPAVLLAFTAGGPDLALWTALLFLLIQQLEGNLIQPLVQTYAVEIPPALFLFALLLFGSLFGAAGILLAAPLAVVSYVLVKRLYVREALATPTSIPGERRATGEPASAGAAS